MISLSLRRLALVVAIAMIASAAFAQTGGITGKVKDEKGEILVGYPIVIERLDIKGSYNTKTDKHGVYTYIGLPTGNYKITLQDLSGKTLFFMNNIRVGVGDPTVKDFNLAQERKVQETSPEYQKQQAEQAKEQKQFGSLKQAFDQAVALENQQKYAEAAALYEQALPLAKGKNETVVMHRLADSYRRAKDYDKAVAAYQKLIQAQQASTDAQAKTEEASAHDGLGNLYADMRKIAEAQQEFQKAAELNPAGADHEYFNLGAVMYNQGKMDEAAEAFKKAISINPKLNDAYFLEGQALLGKATYDKEGKIVPAPGTTEAFDNYLKADPTGKYANDAKTILQTLQGPVQTEYKAAKKKKS